MEWPLTSHRSLILTLIPHQPFGVCWECQGVWEDELPGKGSCSIIPLLLAGVLQCGTERAAGLGRAFLPSPGSGIVLCFWKHEKEMILLRKHLPLPLQHGQWWGTGTQDTAFTPAPVSEGGWMEPAAARLSSKVRQQGGAVCPCQDLQGAW